MTNSNSTDPSSASEFDPLPVHHDGDGRLDYVYNSPPSSPFSHETDIEDALDILDVLGTQTEPSFTSKAPRQYHVENVPAPPSQHEWSSPVRTHHRMPYQYEPQWHAMYPYAGQQQQHDTAPYWYDMRYSDYHYQERMHAQQYPWQHINHQHCQSTCWCEQQSVHPPPFSSHCGYSRDGSYDHKDQPRRPEPYSKKRRISCMEHTSPSSSRRSNKRHANPYALHPLPSSRERSMNKGTAEVVTTPPRRHDNRDNAENEEVMAHSSDQHAVFDTKTASEEKETDASTASQENNSNDAMMFCPHQEIKWQARYDELVQYKQVYGTTCVPNKWASNYALAQWVKRQRYQYRLKHEGKPSTMTKERQFELEKLGFVWDLHSSIWEERFNELIEFRNLHGHCKVPLKYTQNPELAIWAKCQRRQFKMFLSTRQQQSPVKKNIAKSETINDGRFRKLSQAGFVFSNRSHCHQTS